MKNRLVVTLTTVRGSRQFYLGQITRYLIIAFVLLSAVSFFVSNPLLLATSDDLDNLSEDHEILSQEYEAMLGSQQLHKSEMDDLSRTLNTLMSEQSRVYQTEVDALTTSLTSLQDEKARLELENLRIGARNLEFEKSLTGLEELLGMPVSDEMTQERAEELQVAASKRLYFLHQIPNGLPIQGTRITARYGPRLHPVLKKRHMHNGVDFKAKRGTPIYATADAVVEYAGFHKQSGFGKLIILQHSFGFKTYYAHLSRIAISSRSFVRKGQLIGYSGNTGISTGPHLHYEVRHLFTPLDPAPFLAWSLSDFDSIFSKVKEVKWASLQEMYPLNQNMVAPPVPPSSPKEINSAAK